MFPKKLSKIGIDLINAKCYFEHTYRGERGVIFDISMVKNGR
jgi:hypothetical protein